MIREKTWEEFRNTGLVVFINQFLHIFGWAITFEMDDDGKLVRCFPARVSFKGFESDSVDNAYNKITKYMKENSDELYREFNLNKEWEDLLSETKTDESIK